MKCRDTAGGMYNSGRTFVSFDAMPSEINVKMLHYETCTKLDLNDCCVDAVRRLFGLFMQLTDRDRKMICFLLGGGSLGEFARTVGMTKQAIHSRVARLACRHKELAWMSQSAAMQGCNAKKEAVHAG
jgi:hypothetical protein